MVTADGIEYLESFMGTKGPDPFTQSIEGFGNYLKSDVLWEAKIHPRRRCSTLTDDEIERLEQTIASRMNASYSVGGFTIESVPTTL